ncbi:ATP-binding cassette transporter sub-family C member 9 [Harpegnathos saltator]|uniref:ATP-binding cassette transporter sub-family C member 9 n=1 Tax=Harpegnathos saltator TaxID=610380 RepID=E2C386_HARSA|nr:ATP-binding cassette transporter sub-family C member 9 [Harpegnathos saltator]
MVFCARYRFLHMLPRSKNRIIWTWQAANGTVSEILEKNPLTMAECTVELMNVSVAALTTLVALILIVKYKCDANKTSSKSLLPFHTFRTLLCMLLLLTLLLELCESLLTSIVLSSILTIIAVISCWILHRETEIRDGFGTAASGGGFAIICLTRLWKLYHLHSKITFHWVTDLLWRGYRTPLELHDLGDLPKEETMKRQFERFRSIYEIEKLRCRGRKLSLWKCLWKRIWMVFAAGGLLKLLGDATTLVSPMMISKIIDYVSDRQNSISDKNLLWKRTMTFSEISQNGYFLGIVVFLAIILQSTLSQAYTHIVYVTGIRLRTALQALIYDKALRLPSWSISEEEKPSNKDKEQHSPSQAADIGTLTNLMAEDAYNVMSFFWIGHYVWAIPLKITAIIFLLYLKLGVSAIFGAICCILIVTPMQLILGKRMSANFRRITEESDARLRLVNEILQGIRLIKLRAWENIFEERVCKAREKELKLLNKNSTYCTFVDFVTHASSILMTLFTFGIYFWLEERNLDAGNVFASLALFSQMAVPLFIFPTMVSIIINARISTTRLEDFLRLPEVMNILPEQTDRKSSIVEHRFSKSTLRIENNIKTNKISSVATNGSLDDIVESESEENQLPSVSRESHLEIDSSVDTVFEQDPKVPDSVVKITPSVFTWGSDDNTLVLNELNFPRGQLTVIVGKTGSGKTSLLQALLGEIQRMSGSVEWAKNLKIAYVAQRPWLLNSTLKDNILFGSTYCSQRYLNVLRACALHPDIDILPDRDLTRVGERGINLSGGQKQRVTIARAIYSDADVILLDDPLSALDQHVGQHIFDYGVRRFLLRSGRTVIMVTHKLELLSAAHQVIVMDSCRVRAVGTKSSIEDVDSELATEWRIAASRQQDDARSQRTARDRWSLVKLVSRLNVRDARISDGSWIADHDAHVSPSVFVPLRLRRTTLGSRYLAYDLTDLPVSTEEWNSGIKRSKTCRDTVRSASFQSQRPPPVLRQSSTPIILENRHVAPRKRNNTYDNGQHNSVLKQLFSTRVIVQSEEGTISRDKSVLRKLMSGSNKLRQHQEEDHFPAKLLLWRKSQNFDDMDEVEEVFNYEDVHEQNAIESDDKSGLVTGTIWMEYFRAGGWLSGNAYIVTALACQVLRVCMDLWLSRWTEQNTSSTTNERQDMVSYFKVYIIISLSSILASLLYNVASQWTDAKAKRKLHREAVSGLLGAPISFFDCNPAGKILNRFSADVGVIDKKLATSLKRLTFFVLLCGSSMILNVAISLWFFFAAFLTGCAYYMLQKFYRQSARQLQRLDGSTRGPVATHFSETLSGLPTLRAFKQEDRFMEEAMKRIDANTNAFLILNTSDRWLGIALDYLGAIIVVTAIFAALLSAEMYPSRVTPALVGLAINYTLVVPIYLNWVVKFTTDIEKYMGSVARISAYRNTQPENYHENGLQVPDNWPSKGEIIFDNVSLSYNADRDSVISNLTLRIPAGQKLGICGRTGSGKSSTVMALFQLVEISQGRILIDGIDIKQIPLRTLRSRLLAIPQDAIMFSGTIRENLDPLLKYNDYEIWKALELSQIKEVIASHPDGLDFEVREGGENFSTGQLQLLCMARAVLQQSSIVILDEATSALDVATEKLLLQAAAAAFADKTVITIAHRAMALLDCDRIIVFDEGKIVEEGSPVDLMQRQDGIFATMVTAIN